MSIKIKQDTRVTGIIVSITIAFAIVCSLAFANNKTVNAYNDQQNIIYEESSKKDTLYLNKDRSNDHTIDLDIVSGVEKEFNRSSNDQIDLGISSGAESAIQEESTVTSDILPESGSGNIENTSDLTYFILTEDGILEESENWMRCVLNPITDADLEMYATTKLNVRAEPSSDSEAIDKLHIKDKIKVTGIVDDDWARIELEDGSEAYVNRDFITDSIYSIESSTYNYSWDGKKLEKGQGVLKGPSGKETYYNLDMGKIVNGMRKRGNNDEYWVRSDGAKMLGDYVMVAANLKSHPRGSLVETSMGTGIVVDTGSFAANNPTQIDIAVAW